MNEFLLGLSQYQAAILDVDFSQSAFGSADIIDRGIQTWSVGGPAGGVKAVDDSEMGRVMEFTGGYFQAPRQAAFNLATKSFRLEAVMKRVSTASGVVFSTGDFNTIRVYGLIHSINYAATTRGQQMFVDHGDWTRILSNTDFTLGWERVVFTRIVGKGYTVEVYRNDVLIGSVNYPDFAPGAGNSFMRLGASVDDASAKFNGRIKTYKITLL